MSSQAKARVVGSIVALLALWPLAHRQLVTRFDVNPWKLYGFAMYCTPHTVRVELFDNGGSGQRRIDPAILPLETQRELVIFQRLRRTLGRLHDPEPLARTIFAAWPELERLQISVTVIRLPALADSLEAEVVSYPYAR